VFREKRRGPWFVSKGMTRAGTVPACSLSARKLNANRKPHFLGKYFGLRLLAGYGIAQHGEGRPVNDVLKQAV
jgi:hypothetical protein